MLNAKRRAFCEEYVICLNGTQAAIAAGYEEKSAAQEASRLLRDVKVRSYIGELQGAKRKIQEIRADDILEELHDIAFDTENPMKDRLRALEMLAKHKALLTEKIEVKVDDGLSERLKRMREKSSSAGKTVFDKTISGGYLDDNPTVRSYDKPERT